MASKQQTVGTLSGSFDSFHNPQITAPLCVCVGGVGGYVRSERTLLGSLLYVQSLLALTYLELLYF